MSKQWLAFSPYSQCIQFIFNEAAVIWIPTAAFAHLKNIHISSWKIFNKPETTIHGR